MAKWTASCTRVLAVRSHVRCIGLFILIGGIVLIILYAGQGVLAHPFDNTSDATIYAEVGFKLNDLHLYVHDPAISSQVRDFFTVAFYTLLPDAWESLNNVGTTYTVLGLFFGLVFGVGIYLLVYEIFERHDIALLTGLVSMLVGRGLMQTPVGWGVRVITPRFIVFGLSPWLLWLYWRWRKTWKVAFVFAGYGALLFMHPRFSVYPAALLGIGLLLQERPSVRHWVRTAARAAPFVPFLAVVLCLTLNRLGTEVVSGGEGVSVELSPYDFPGGLLRQLFFSGIDAAVPVVLGVLGWRDKRRRQGIRRDEREAFRIFSLAPVALYAVLWLAVQWFPGIKLLNIKRFLSYAYVVPYAFGAYWLLGQWRRGGLSRRLVAVLAIIALVFATYSQARVVFLDDNAAYRQLVGLVYDRFAPARTREQHDVRLTEAAQAADIEDDWGSFYAVCDWARANTDVDAVFVVPPARFSLFRLYSQRSLYATARSVGIGSLYESEGNLLWEKYQAATAAYVSGTLDVFQDLVPLGRADYIVVERGKLSLSAPLVYENRRYLVYALPTRGE
jgi:hypothetical protein